MLDEDEVDTTDDYDVPDSDPTAICIDRWRNAGPEERKHMWKMFDECGIFLCSCRHGIILYLCDMIHSGEQ